jgi:hypothetical protein
MTNTKGPLLVARRKAALLAIHETWDSLGGPSYLLVGIVIA